MAEITVQTETLLDHLSWARTLALHLVRDEATADDLVQEAWLRTAAHPPRGGEPLRPWLSQVLRNLVRMRHRSESRRRVRQAVAPSGELPLDAASLHERLETQRMLAELVSELDEPYKQTILLRYYEGLSAADIAREQSVPAGTVRWRLKTGLDMLRARLDTRFQGRRENWLPLLLAIGVPMFGASAAQAQVASTAARELPTRAIALRVAAVGALAAALGLFVRAHAPTTTLPRARAAQAASAASAGISRQLAAAGACTGESCTRPASDGVVPPETRPSALNHGNEPHSHVSLVLPDGLASPAGLEDALSRCVVNPALEGRLDLAVALSEDGDDYVVDQASVRKPNLLAGAFDSQVESCVLGALSGQRFAGNAEHLGTSVPMTLLAGPCTRVEDGVPAQQSDEALATLPSVGPADAPVTMVVYGDYPCVFCAQAVARVEELTRRYPRNLRVVFRQVPVKGQPIATLAAEAALAAHAQGKFWAMHRALFRDQLALDRAHLTKLALEVGLDVSKFDDSLAGHEFAAALRTDEAAADADQVSGAPAFVIGDETVVGIRPLEALALMVDDELEKVRAEH